jgi:hypothetical protein
VNTFFDRGGENFTEVPVENPQPRVKPWLTVPGHPVHDDEQIGEAEASNAGVQLAEE